MNTPKAMVRPFQYARAILWRSARRLGFVPPDDTLQDQSKDRVAPFDEYPPCGMCGSEAATEVLIAKDGNRLVECDLCGLWFTSPRIKEPVWTEYLRTTTDRSVEFTENRLKYGVALAANAKYTLPDWRERRMRAEHAIIDEIEGHLGREPRRLHDVGCGVGFLLQAARERGIEATGNELNVYACQVMRERLGLTVYNQSLPDLVLKPGSLDAVVMHDYIEHTYHPLRDLEAACKFMRPGGVLSVTTFHVDCRTFERLREDWSMLFWNHTYHFSTKTLSEMVCRAGFDVLDVKTGYEDVLVTITARK